MGNELVCIHTTVMVTIGGRKGASERDRKVNKGCRCEWWRKWRESVITVPCILGTKHNLGIQTQRRLLLTGYIFFS